MPDLVCENPCNLIFAMCIGYQLAADVNISAGN